MSKPWALMAANCNGVTVYVQPEMVTSTSAGIRTSDPLITGQSLQLIAPPWLHGKAAWAMVYYLSRDVKHNAMCKIGFNMLMSSMHQLRFTKYNI